MNDLTTLLDRAAGPMPLIDVTGDVARGRRALNRSRRRRGAASLLGVAAASVLGVGFAGKVLDPRPTHSVTNGPATQPGSVTKGPFTFAAPPEGWSVQAAHPYGVVLAPDAGGVDDDPNSYVGKLVFYLENNKQQSGDHTTYAGRDFWVRNSADAPAVEEGMPIGGRDGKLETQGSDKSKSLGSVTVISTRIPGRAHGSLTVQYPDSAGFTVEQMVAFLASIEVGPSAKLTYG